MIIRTLLLVYGLIGLALPIETRAGCLEVLPAIHAQILTGPRAKAEDLLLLAKANGLTEDHQRLVSKVIESFTRHDLPLPKAYPSRFFQFPDEEASDSTSAPDIFKLIQAENRNFRLKWWTGEEPTIHFPIWKLWQLKKIRHRYGIKILRVADPETILRYETKGDYSGAMRKTLAASRLNELMGLHTVPRARPVWLSRNYVMVQMTDLAVQSELSPGKFVIDEDDFTYTNGHKSNSEAFEFLLGNADIAERNITIHDDSQVFVFDHNYAFLPGFVPSKNWYGHSLPERYTPEFIAGIKNLTPEIILKNVGHLLTEQEFLWVLFRRQMILTDIEERGSDAEFVQSPPDISE